MTALAAIITALGMLITAGATAYATIKNVDKKVVATSSDTERATKQLADLKAKK